MPLGDTLIMTCQIGSMASTYPPPGCNTCVWCQSLTHVLSHSVTQTLKQTHTRTQTEAPGLC